MKVGFDSQKNIIIYKDNMVQERMTLSEAKDFAERLVSTIQKAEGFDE